MFITVNLEEGGDGEEDDTNPNLSLMAHEWVETIMRMAHALHSKDSTLQVA